MADDRSGPGVGGPADELHDDDELAEALAAELQRYATGAVPTVPAPGTAPAPASGRRAAAAPSGAPDSAPVAAAPSGTAPAPAAFQRPRRRDPATDAPSAGRAALSGLPASTDASRPDPRGSRAAAEPAADEEAPIRRRSGFRPPAPSSPPARATPLERVLPTLPVPLPERTASLLDEGVAGSAPDVAERSPQPVLPVTAPERLPSRPEADGGPARDERRPGPAPVSTADGIFVDEVPGPPTPERPRAERSPQPPAERSLQQQPAEVQPLIRQPLQPEPESELQPESEPAPEPEPEPDTRPSPQPPQADRFDLDEVSTVLIDVPARAPVDTAAADLPLVDPLRGTGPLVVPRPLYSDWEQSLRSIGRPRSPWDDDDDEGSPLRGGAPVDSATVAMPVRQGRPGPAPAPDGQDPFGGALQQDDPPAPTGRIRRKARRRVAEDRPEDAVVPAAEALLPEPMPIVSGDAPDDEGIDDVEPPHPQISAATTGAIDLPIAEPRPRTAPVLVERVRTALLQLPVVPDSPTGTAAAALAGRWVGALFSPLLLLVAFGTAAAGAGPAASVLALAGVLVALPAAARSAAWAASAAPDRREEPLLLGPAGGGAAAAVLLIARIAAAALAVFAIASTVSAWVARTGALGGSASNSAVVAAAAVGVVALGVAALPVRAVGALVQVLGALGVIGTILLVLLLAPTATPPASGGGGGSAAAVAAGFAAVGLVLVLCSADLVRWRTDLARPRGAVVGTAVGAAVGVLALAIGLLVAGGAEGDAADAFAGALSDGSAADLAAPLAIVLLGSSLVLPILLLRSSGAAATRLLGRGGGDRLGVLATGLLAIAGALALLAAGSDVAGAAAMVGGLAGVPVAAWAGIRTLARPGDRRTPLLVGAATAVVLGWALSDALVPGLRSPVLDALLPAGAAGLRGGPAAGLLVAFVVGLLAAVAARAGGRPAATGPRAADTVEG